MHPIARASMLTMPSSRIAGTTAHTLLRTQRAKTTPRLISSFSRGIYPSQAECRFAVAAAQHPDELVRVQLFGTAFAVDHFHPTHSSRAWAWHLRLTIGSPLSV
jgi:hypothetical protein